MNHVSKFFIMFVSASSFSFTALAGGQLPPGWTCDNSQYNDELCDCGCGATDPACDTGGFASCEVDNCAAGKAPWEHENRSCMDSTCGDGWKSSTEACDDFNATNEGGCNANCSAVMTGYVCGDRAEGCSVNTDIAPPDAGVDAGTDAGIQDGGVNDGGTNTDAGSNGDAGVGSDSGNSDSGTQDDAGSSSDAGTSTDAGNDAGGSNDDDQSSGCASQPSWTLWSIVTILGTWIISRRKITQ